MTTLTDLLTNKIPPHSLEVERAVLGCVLLERDGADRILARLDGQDFYKEAHRRIFDALTRIAEAGHGVELLTVSESLRLADELDEIGGPAYLASLVEEATTLSELAAYAQHLREYRARRETIRVATEAIGRAYDSPDPASAIASDLSDALQQLATRVDGPTGKPHQSIGGATAHVLAQLERGERPHFLPTPFPWLDEQLGGGLLAGELVFLGGRPGVAKSALELEWVVLAEQKGFPSLVISREMTIDALARRVLAQQAQVPARRLRSGAVDADDLRRLKATVQRLKSMRVIFDEGAGTIGQIEARAARAAQAGVRFLVVDYLQLIRGPKGSDRRVEVETVSAALKAIALRRNLVVLALSSLTPPPPGKNRKPLPPDMASLRESRALEHDADVVLLLHRPDPEAPGRELILAKARDGATGRCELHFEAAYLRFRESAAAAGDSFPPLDPDDPRNEVPF